MAVASSFSGWSLLLVNYQIECSFAALLSHPSHLSHATERFKAGWGLLGRCTIYWVGLTVKE